MRVVVTPLPSAALPRTGQCAVLLPYPAASPIAQSDNAQRMMGTGKCCPLLAIPAPGLRPSPEILLVSGSIVDDSKAGLTCPCCAVQPVICATNPLPRGRARILCFSCRMTRLVGLPISATIEGCRKTHLHKKICNMSWYKAWVVARDRPQIQFGFIEPSSCCTWSKLLPSS
jgi:hypothetical protein